MITETADLLGKDRVFETLRQALAHSKADQTEVTLGVGRSGLTRFAGSAIHQNVAERNAGLSVRAVLGRKVGFASTSSLSAASVVETVEKAFEFARNQHDNPDFVSLPGPKVAAACPAMFYESTVGFGPAQRAEGAGAVIDEAVKRGAEAAGSFSTSVLEFGVVNSLGAQAYAARTGAGLSTVITAGTGSGMASRVSMDVEEIAAAEVGREAADRAAASKDPVGVEAGEYDVVLLPYAVGEFLDSLAYVGLGALAVQEGRSFMCGKFGERICGEQISVWDDGLDPRGIVMPFDPEGVPKQRVDLIVNGVAKGVVYDSYTAHKEGKESTGHSTGGSSTFGPYPNNLFIAAGTSSVDEMIASVKRGLFVSRFHYVNVVHPIQTVITGMTRDGTFLIEDGKITKPVRNLRFTESVLRALSNVELVGRDLLLLGSARVPAMKVRGFRFTGVTEF